MMDILDLERTPVNALKVYVLGLSLVVSLAIAYYYSSVPVSKTQSTTLSVISLVASNVLFPVTIIAVILYTHAMIKDILLTNYHKLFLLLIELMLLILAMTLSASFPVFSCNIIGCTASALPPPSTAKYQDDYNEMASGTNGLVSIIIIMTIISIILLSLPSSRPLSISSHA